jgi:di/tricarboxylate transporter
MVGSGPLILINDLLRGAELAPYGLFSVTPVGMVLLLSGIGFFFVFGKFVLPHSETSGEAVSEQDKLIHALHLPHRIWHYAIPQGSALAGKTTEQSGVWEKFNLNILGISQGREAQYAPWRDAKFAAGQEMALLGKEENVKKFASAYNLIHQEKADRFSNLNDPKHAGFAEVIIPPRSEMMGQTLRQFSLRKRYAVEPVMMFSKGEEIRGDFSDRQILPGDTMVVYGLWENISDLKTSSDFVVATPFTVEKKQNPSKLWVAALCFLCAIGLALTGAPISLAFFTGAIAMVLTRSLTIQEAYQAIEWKVVFLLAGLIPLGVAMQKTGTAAFLAQNVMSLVAGGHPALILLTVAVLSTMFSLLMSNVGAIVVLAPLVISMAQIGGLDPRPLALMAAVCAANSFILPTHQVNAFLMSSGGYRNADYFKAGGAMTLLFLVVVVPVFYFFYL